MAWDFTGGLLSTGKETSEQKQNKWDFTGGLSSVSNTPDMAGEIKSPAADFSSEFDPETMDPSLQWKAAQGRPASSNVNPEFAAKHPTFTKVAETLSSPIHRVMSNPFMERAGQTGAEIMTTVDNPNKATTGNRLADIAADLTGSLMGFVSNPAGGIQSAGAGLWGLSEKGVEAGMRRIPQLSKLPAVAQTGLKLGATTVPYEAAMAAVNERDMSAGEMGTAAVANALLGMAPYGIGKILGGKAPKVEMLKLEPLPEMRLRVPEMKAPEVQPLQPRPILPIASEKFSITPGRSKAERVNEDILRSLDDWNRKNLGIEKKETLAKVADRQQSWLDETFLPRSARQQELKDTIGLNRPLAPEQTAEIARRQVTETPRWQEAQSESKGIFLRPLAKAEASKPRETITPITAEPGEPLTAEAIKAARSKVQNMDDVLKVNETPEGPVMLYSGIPAEKVAESVKDAAAKLHDSLGIPLKGSVEVVPRPGAKQPGIMAALKSPSRVAREFPQVREFVDSGVKATETQERLRNVFNQRLAAVDKVLTGNKLRFADPLRATYRQNKEALSEILLTGDMMGRKFTPAELRSEFGASEEVIRGYNLLRAAYDHAHTIASNTRELRGKTPVSYREGYIPHFFHSWFITVDGQVAGSAKTLREAVAMSNPVARQKGANIKIVPKTFDFPGGDIQAAVMGDLNYFSLKGKIEKDFGISAADAQALLEGVARMKGRSRFVGNFMQRKGAQGWEKNLDWVNRHYFNMISRYAALDQFKSKAITSFERQFGAFDNEHKGVAEYVKNYINDINGNPTQVEDLINNSLAKVPALSKFLGTYLGERPALQLASATTKGVAIAKLGLYNVSSAMVNATQLINTYARLGERWTFEGLRRAASLGAKNALQRIGLARAPMSDMGVLKQLGIDTQMGLETGAGYSKAADVGKLFNKSMAIFQSVENFNRRVTGLGAYHKAIAEGKAPRQAIEYAKGIIDSTQFDYSIAETPAFIRRSGPVGQILFQFKKFPVKQLEFITQLKGAENPRFWIPFTLLAGYYAMPGIEMLKNSVKSMFDIDIELEAKKHLMEWAGYDKTKQAAAKTIMYGIGANAGVDISRRIGTGDFIPGEASDFAGPAVSTVVRAAQLAGKKEWLETLRAISPAAGNLALMVTTDQEISDPWNRGRLKAVLTPTEKALKGVGFAPASESVERDVSRVISYSEQKRQAAEQSAIDGYIKALATGDSDKINKAVERLEELKITPDRVKTEMGKKGMLPAERALSNVPKKRQEDYSKVYGFK